MILKTILLMKIPLTDTTDTEDTSDTEDAVCIEIDLGATSGDTVAIGNTTTADNTYVDCGDEAESVTSDTALWSWHEGMRKFWRYSLGQRRLL